MPPVLPDEPVEGFAADRVSAVAGEENGGVVLAGVEMGLEGFGFVRLQRMNTGEGAFEPVNVDCEALEIEVGELEEADFRGSKSMAVGDQKQGAIALVGDDAEESLELVKRQELDGFLAALHENLVSSKTACRRRRASG